MIFPKRLSKLCFSWDFQNVIVKTVETSSVSSQTGAVEFKLFQKQGKTWLLINVKGNKSFSCNYICSSMVSFVSTDTITNHLHVVALNEMFSQFRTIGHDFIRMLMFCSTNFVTKKEHQCVLSGNAVLFVKYFFQYNNMFSFYTLSSTTQWNVDRVLPLWNSDFVSK